jgi:hypothetical protein
MLVASRNIKLEREKAEKMRDIILCLVMSMTTYALLKNERVEICSSLWTVVIF